MNMTVKKYDMISSVRVLEVSRRGCLGRGVPGFGDVTRQDENDLGELDM